MEKGGAERLPEILTRAPEEAVQKAQARDKGLNEEIGRLKMQLEGLKKLARMGTEERRRMIEPAHPTCLRPSNAS